VSTASTANTACPFHNGKPFDPLDPDQVEDPFPWMAEARRSAPVFYLEKYDVWCITRYADVEQVLRDTENISSANAIRIRPLPPELQDVFPDGHPLQYSLLLKDPPEHNRLRKIANRAFTPTAVASYEPRIREFANQLIDAFIDDGHCDLVKQFSSRLPVMVITDIVGAPTDRDLGTWARDTMALVEGAPELTPERAAELADRARPIMEWLVGFVEERRETPRDDLTSAVLTAANEEGERHFTTDQVIGFIDSLLIAGVETTQNFIALGMRDFLRRPETWEELKRDRSLVPNALEEALRYRTPSRGSRRLAKNDVTIGDVTIPKGAQIYVLHASPQRDDAVFPDPDTFDIHRDNLSKHMTFGRYTHACLGAPLARLEGRIALETFLERIPNMRLVQGQEYHWVPNMTIPGFLTLEVEWDLPIVS
jgi:cytochrome P450